MSDANPEPGTYFDPSSGPGTYQFTTLSNQDREDLAAVTNLTYTDQGAKPFQISNLELTALGANAEIEGAWSVSWSNLAAWHDLSQNGRALRGLVARRGYLFPLGHRATLTTYFERVVATDPDNSANRSNASKFAVAYLQMHSVLRVTEQVKAYGAGTAGEPFTAGLGGGASDWPFSQVRMITLKTPDLDSTHRSLFDASLATYQPSWKQWADQAFWPTYTLGTTAGLDVMWSFVATDLEGRDATFSMPLVFVYGQDLVGSDYPGSQWGADGFTRALVDAYHDGTGTHVRYSGTAAGAAPPPAPGTTSTPTGGVHLRLALESGGVAGGTRHPTLSIMLAGATSSYDPNGTSQPTSPGPAALEAANQPDFYPVLRRARIRLHAAEVLTGGDVDDSGGDGLLPGPGVEIEWYPDYVSGDPSLYGAGSTGNGANPGAVYMRIADDNLNLQLPANTTGGIGTPSTVMSGLSAYAGIVGGDLSSFAQGAPIGDLASYFPQALDPQLLGGLHLSDILDAAGFTMPTISAQTLTSAAGLTSAPAPGTVTLDGVSTGSDPTTGAQSVTYNFQTPLTPYSSSLVSFQPASDSGQLSMTATVQASLDGSTPTYSASGSIDPFSVTIASLIELVFSSFTFSSGSGQSTSVTPGLETVNFEGCLEFVQTLESYLSALGAGGFTVDVQPTEVTIGLSISVPAVQTGMFNLSGISFAAGAMLPFLTGKAVATFAFASSDNPFTLTCCCFGGGGFVSLGVGFGGLQTLQASFEVEGQAAIGIVVASGNVTFAVGIYYSYDATSGADLSGFVTVSGQVELLGIITVSIVLHVSLTWEITAGAVQGSATLEVGISICGFGVTVGVTVTKSFGGSTSNQSSTSTSVSPGTDGEDPALARPALARPVLARPDLTPPGPHGPGGPIAPVGTLHGAGGGGALPGPQYQHGPITFAQLISEQDWDQYCEAF